MELCHETDWPHFVIRGVFSSWSFYERQSHKLARPIGWLGLYESKYSPLAGDEVLLKNFEPFFEKFDFKHRHVMSADSRISPYTAVSFDRSF